MSVQLSYKPEKYDNFGIHKTLDYKSCKVLKDCNLKSIIDRALSTYKLNEIVNPKRAYYYYLSRFMDRLSWYKDDIFKFWECVYAPNPYNELLFVQNVETGMIDNIIPLRLFIDIRNRIMSQLRCYIAHRHAIQRARNRIFELHNLNNFEIESWLLKQVNTSRTVPCHLISQYNTLQLLNHNFQECDYRMDEQGRVYVLVNHKIMTVHWNESDRFKKD